jgi:hypothetical protein
MARTRTRTTLQATIHRLVSLALAPAACGGSALLVVSGEAGAPDASATTGEATMRGAHSRRPEALGVSVGSLQPTFRT